MSPRCQYSDFVVTVRVTLQPVSRAAPAATATTKIIIFFIADRWLLIADCLPELCVAHHPQIRSHRLLAVRAVLLCVEVRQIGRDNLAAKCLPQRQRVGFNMSKNAATLSLSPWVAIRLSEGLLYYSLFATSFSRWIERSIDWLTACWEIFSLFEIFWLNTDLLLIWYRYALDKGCRRLIASRISPIRDCIAPTFVSFNKLFFQKVSLFRFVTFLFVCCFREFI